MKKTHGMTHSREWNSWKAMRERCRSHGGVAWDKYGGRGIRVCERWLNSFENFFSDMGERPTGHSIERIDNDGHYTPENCKWATRLEQSGNRRCVIKVGDVPLKRYCRENGFRYYAVWKRIRRNGMSVVEALKARRYDV